MMKQLSQYSQITNPIPLNPPPVKRWVNTVVFSCFLCFFFFLAQKWEEEKEGRVLTDRSLRYLQKGGEKRGGTSKKKIFNKTTQKVVS